MYNRCIEEGFQQDCLDERDSCAIVERMSSDGFVMTDMGFEHAHKLGKPIMFARRRQGARSAAHWQAHREPASTLALA